MERHDRPNATIHSFLKWYQLDTIEPISAHRHDRQRKMRVYTGVAVPREVLASRNHTVALKSPDERSAETGNEPRIRTVRSRVDYWIGRVVVDVEHRSVSDVDPECSALLSRKPSFLEGKRRIPRCANRHLGRRYHRTAKVDCIRN